jgi:SAM-dependent methyltransferase
LVRSKVVELRPEIASFYEQGREEERLSEARIGLLCAELGDARHLSQQDRSVDFVLLMGPLSHLLEASERSRALAEAYRVLRPGGLLIATAVSRSAALQDLLVRLDRLHEPDVMAIVERAVRTGIFDGSPAGLFTSAFFHSPGRWLSRPLSGPQTRHGLDHAQRRRGAPAPELAVGVGTRVRRDTCGSRVAHAHH